VSDKPIDADKFPNLPPGKGERLFERVHSSLHGYRTWFELGFDDSNAKPWRLYVMADNAVLHTRHFNTQEEAMGFASNLRDWFEKF
jgi:hypothetical protein